MFEHGGKGKKIPLVVHFLRFSMVLTSYIHSIDRCKNKEHTLHSKQSLPFILLRRTGR